MFKFSAFAFLCLISFNLLFSAEILCEKKALFDQEIQIQVTGLEPFQFVDIVLTTTDPDQTEWRSYAIFQADEKGVVNLADQAPIQGTYKNADSMGLFWSMEMGEVLDDEVLTEDIEYDAEGSWYIITHMKVFTETGEVAQKNIYRIIKSREVQFINVEEDGILGNLFLPYSNELLPVVIVLTGSNGGIPTMTASILASRGIAAFALAYSGIGDLPPTIKDIPIEYFEKAFEWIQKQPYLNGRIALHGTSRGAELALLLGSMFPEKIDRIVAKAPSSVVLSTGAWIYKDQPVLPAAPYLVDLNNDYRSTDTTREHPCSIKICRERGLFIEKERFEAAFLPVEKITCPLLLISGGDDQIGPCSIYTQQILERLDRYHSTIKKDHLYYPLAGHLIGMPNLPKSTVIYSDGIWLNMGGSPQEDEIASRDSWRKTLEFLKEEQFK